MIELRSSVPSTMPPSRWTIPEQDREAFDFAGESRTAFERIAQDAAFAFEIGMDEQGALTDSGTGGPGQQVAETYSRMKHGDLDAVNFFAGHLAATAMQSERFLAINNLAVRDGQVIYMTTTAEFNVPSSSNLLLSMTAGHLNIMLALRGMAPVVVAEQTRISEGPLGYSSRAVRARRDDLMLGRGLTIMPAHFRDQSVIFVDDLFSTGYTLYRAVRRLEDIQAAERFFLFAVKMDPQAVGKSQGQIEDRLNDACMDGSLASLAPLLQRGNFVVVQKLLRVALDPEHTDQLAAFLREIPTAAILNLYAAAISGGFQRRSEGCYRPSIHVLETVLEERGRLDADGHVIGARDDLVALA